MAKLRPDLADLVRTAMSQDKLAGLCEVLRCFSESHDAYGCILWEVTPGSDLGKGDGSLFPLAHWFVKEPSWVRHDLKLRSVTGSAVISGETINVPDIWKDDRIDKDQPFFQHLHPEVMCSIPISFQDGARGAVNLYRKQRCPFAPAEVRRAEVGARLVPELYQAIRNRVGFQLLRRINDILHQAELESVRAPLPTENVREFIVRIAKEVQDTFHCIETSIFLEDPLDTPGVYQMLATTWPEPVEKTTYLRNEERLTSWILRTGKDVKIFDLAHFERDRENIQRDYPGLTWSDTLHIESAVRRFLPVGPEDELQPLSFIGAPILAGDVVRGAVRCCTARKAPYYYAAREVSLLTMIANQISQLWTGWISARAMEEENRSWRALVESVGKMNNFVHHELSEKSPNEIRIFEKGLEVTKEIIRGAEIMDVRLRDSATSQLYFAAPQGDAWTEGTQQEIDDRKKRRFKLDSPSDPESAGAHVYFTKEAHVIDDVSKDPYYSATFPGVKRMIIAPIKSEELVFGVIDIRARGGSGFPRHAKAVAELLGVQLGLYHYLAVTISELNRVKTEQAQAYEDLGHQLKTTVFQAHARVKVLFDTRLPSLLEPPLTAIRLLLMSAERVGNSIRLFADLAREGTIHAKPALLDYTVIVDTVERATKDNALLVPPFRNVKFRTERGSFSALRKLEMKLDLNLFVQALNCVLDNAGKYSSQNTVIHVSSGMAGKERFHILVQNAGLRLTAADVKRCRERGWRGEEAGWITGEGSGIGLWVADHIMRAHGGELEIVPTNRFGTTQVKLVFPCARM